MERKQVSIGREALGTEFRFQPHHVIVDGHVTMALAAYNHMNSIASYDIIVSVLCDN